MLIKYAKKIYTGVAVLAIMSLPLMASAQQLTLTPTTQTINPDYTVIALIATRMILVLALVITGIMTIMSGHNWMYAEGSTDKSYNSKQALAREILVITILFFLLATYRAFIPDYSVLSL